MAQFSLSLPYILDNEGRKYSEPPHTDQPTNCGIIAATYADYLGVAVSRITKQMIKDLRPDVIADIYDKLFWTKLGLSNVSDQNIATCIFDTGVNRGRGIGALYAQQTCNYYHSALDLDGVIGPITIAALNKMHRESFIPYYERLVWAGYQAILARKPEDEQYRHSWETRAKKLLTLA